MSKRIHDHDEHNDGSYTVKKTKNSNILAFVLCLLVAFVIWAYTMSYGNDSTVDKGGDDATQVSENL